VPRLRVGVSGERAHHGKPAVDGADSEVACQLLRAPALPHGLEHLFVGVQQ
jgi:hypothetical protein